jgi:D-inositol-3-phosphate glycosyltransferase
MKTNKKRLLIIGLARDGSGFTRVLSTLCQHLAQLYEIHFFGLTRSNTNFQKLQNITYHLWPMKVSQQETGRYFCRLMEEVTPSVVFLLGQPWWLAPLLELLQPYLNSLTIICYMPIEGYLTDIKAIKPLHWVEHCITYTQFSRKNLQEIGSRLQKQDPEFTLPRLHVLPHGVDTSAFYPINHTVEVNFAGIHRKTIRQQLFPHNSELHDAFIVLNANHPYYRKRMDITMKGFKLFSQDKPASVFLYLHHINLDEYGHKQVMRMAQEIGITVRLKLNLLNPRGGAITEQHLNMLYNSCDVGINTAMGEGWGLVSFEHAATGAAQLVPNHTNFIENWEGAAQLLPVIDTEYLFFEHCEMYVVSPEAVAEALEKLYNDKDYMCRMSIAAYRRATSPKYRWSAIADKLHCIILDAVKPT